MGVVEERRDEIAAPTQGSFPAQRALPHPPSVAAPGDDRRIDLFAGSLSDIAYPHLVRLTIETEAPGITHHERVDFVETSRGTGKGIAPGGSVGHAGSVDIDAKDLAEQRVDVLRVVRGIVRTAAITHSDVE